MSISRKARAGTWCADNSGKGKAHKHKQIFPVTARVGGGSPGRVARGLPTGGQGSKVYVLCAEPKEYKQFRPGTRPGGSGTRPGVPVTGVTEKLFMCQMFMCLFSSPKKAHKHKEMGPQNWTSDPTPKTPLDAPPSKFFMHCILLGNQHLHKEFGRLSPLLDPPAGVPSKFFMEIFFGCFFRS